METVFVSAFRNVSCALNGAAIAGILKSSMDIRITPDWLLITMTPMAPASAALATFVEKSSSPRWMTAIFPLTSTALKSSGAPRLSSETSFLPVVSFTITYSVSLPPKALRQILLSVSQVSVYSKLLPPTVMT